MFSDSDQPQDYDFSTEAMPGILLDIENVYMVSHLNLSTLYAGSLKHIVACGEVLQISGSSEHQWECGRAAEAGRFGKCCTELVEFKY